MERAIRKCSHDVTRRCFSTLHPQSIIMIWSCVISTAYLQDFDHQNELVKRWFSLEKMTGRLFATSCLVHRSCEFSSRSNFHDMRAQMNWKYLIVYCFLSIQSWHKIKPDCSSQISQCLTIRRKDVWKFIDKIEASFICEAGESIHFFRD